jgi:PAS domain S-box-containing protein
MSKGGDEPDGALLSGEQEIRLLVETIPTPVWRAAPEGNIEYVNKRALDYFGVPADEILGWGWMDKVHPDDIAYKARTWLNNLQSEAPHDAVCRFRGADGQYRWFIVRGEPLRAGDGRVFRWYGVLIDIDETKKAEDQLRRSETYLAEAQRLSHTGTWVFNATIKAYVYWSEESYRIWEFDSLHGVPDRETIRQRIHPDDRDRVYEGGEEAVRRKRDYAVSYRIVLPDGAIKYIDASSRHLFSARGELVEVVGSHVDVTERRRAEQALRESEHKLRQIIEAVPGLLWVMGSDGETIQLNRRVLDYTGRRFEDFQRRGWKENLHPDDALETETAFYRAVQTGIPHDTVHRIRRADGEFRWHHSLAEPLRDRQGRIVEWYGLSVEIDDRMKAEEALRSSEYNLQKIIETVPGLVWSNGPDGEPTHINQRMLDYSGMRFEEFKHRGWEPFAHPADFPETAEAFYHAIQTGTSYEGVMRLRRADGAFRWHHARCEPLRDPQGRVIQWYGLAVDIDERKKAEDRLRRSEMHLTAAQQLGQTGSFTWKPSTNERLWSDEIYRIFDMDPAPGPDLAKAFERVDPDQRDHIRRLSELVGRGAASMDEIVKLSFPDGSIKFIHLKSRALRGDEDGLEVVGALSDITKFKAAEDAVRESEAKLRDYAETASDWFWEIGPDYKFTLLTENAFGSHAAELIGRACWDQALDLETEPEKWRLIQVTLDSRKPFRDFIYCSALGDGTPMFVRASGRPVFDANGEFLGYRGTGTDVTAIVRAQKALRESEQRSRSAIDGIAGLIAIMAPNGEVETVNRQVIEYFDRSMEWIKNWGTNDAVHPEDLPRILEVFKGSLAAGSPFHYELRLRRFDGEYRWFDNRGVPVRDDSGRIVRWYVLLTDIDDRTRALARLDQMQSDLARMNRLSVMGELAASLAHEIAQPIATARNNAQAALNFSDRSSTDLGQVREALTAVVDDTDRAGEILDRIRDHIKKAPPRKEHVDLNQAITDVLALAQGEIVRNGVSVQIRLTEGLPHVQADRVQVQQVILNLILNAVEAMGSIEEGVRELSITTKQHEAGGVLVAVRDSGPGIDPQRLDRVFDAFYTTKSSGVGMGLSICRSIIDAHGGRLWASANVPQGAIFQLTLPSAENKIMNSLRSSDV